MTIDDESSIYVGGLPYDSTKDTVLRVFEFYGAVLDVKVRQTNISSCFHFFLVFRVYVTVNSFV